MCALLSLKPDFRRPRRLTITIPQNVLEQLERCALQEGRSLSNLAAYLLERALQNRTPVL